jgi:hypothetical protein
MQISVSADGHATSKFDLTERESKILGENSLERVFNLAIDIANQSKHRDANVCYDDLVELKPIAVRMWVTVQAANFAGFNGMNTEDVEWTPKMQATVDFILKEYGEIYGLVPNLPEKRIWAIYREVILYGGLENYNRLFETIQREGNPN